MPLEVIHRGGEGITVPYPPLFDGIRKNRGFVDTRGRPDLASDIAEGLESNALRNCLVKISDENSYFPLGCDLVRTQGFEAHVGAHVPGMSLGEDRGVAEVALALGAASRA